MSCPICEQEQNLYGFKLEKNAYYMTKVPEIKSCCPIKVYVTNFSSTDVWFKVDNKEFKKNRQEFMKSSWRLYDSF